MIPDLGHQWEAGYQRAYTSNGHTRIKNKIPVEVSKVKYEGHKRAQHKGQHLDSCAACQKLRSEAEAK